MSASARYNIVQDRQALPITPADRDRFWSFVDKRGADDCWEWTGYLGPSGYGKLWLNGRTVGAHRLSYLLNNGPIAAGAMIRHTCDNKPCVNPTHLLTGSGKDNARDAVERGLYRRGVDNGRAKLTDEQVHQIKRAWQLGETQVSLARRFAVSRAAIQWVLNGRNWTHVGDAS